MFDQPMTFESAPGSFLPVWRAANPDVDRSGPPAGKKKAAKKKAPAKKPGKKG